MTIETTPVIPVVDPVVPGAPLESPEDLTGLKANRDKILAESKTKDGVIKELTDKLTKFDKAIEEQKTKTLEEQKEYQKLYQDEKEKSSQKDETNRKLQRENFASGFKNKNLIHSFKDKFTYDEGGLINNGKEVMEGLLKDEPYLFESNKPPVNIMGGVPRIGELNLTAEAEEKQIDDDFLAATGGKST